MALRPPRESAEYGRLEEGMEVEVEIRPIKRAKGWKPLTFRSGIKDLSQHIDEIAWAYLDEKYPVRKGAA